MGPLKPDLGELIFGVIVFGLVFAVFAKVLLPRIGKTLAERHDALEGGFDRATDIQAESEAALAELRAQMAETRRETALVRQQAAEEGARLIAEARAEGQRIREELVTTGHEKLNGDVTLATASLHAELGLIATELASKVLGEPVGTLVADSDVIERFMAELAELDETPEGGAADKG
ncbi:F0F1 ATP synthase subunit B family protein [Embleya sp. NPDC055664]|uniref:F0F1 ATP synthase subunit B family protein n=1 Tax=Embleya sp. NPDC059237 TaxID=3346784 RepID=UPI00367C1B3D